MDNTDIKAIFTTEGKEWLSIFYRSSLSTSPPRSSLWWEYNILEWYNLLPWTSCRVPTLPGLHVDCQSTSRIRNLHKFLCYQYRAHLWLHHSLVSSNSSFSLNLYIVMLWYTQNVCFLWALLLRAASLSYALFKSWVKQFICFLFFFVFLQYCLKFLLPTFLWNWVLLKVRELVFHCLGFPCSQCCKCSPSLMVLLIGMCQHCQKGSFISSGSMFWFCIHHCFKTTLPVLQGCIICSENCFYSPFDICFTLTSVCIEAIENLCSLMF